MYAIDSNTVRTSVGSIRDARSRAWAASLLKQGFPVGSFVRAVCALWVDAANEDAIESIYDIKGERRVGRPISTVFSASEFVQMIDPQEVPADLRDVVLDAGELEARFGSLGFLRVPIRKEVAAGLPPSTVSRTLDGKYWLQNYIATPIDSVSRFVAEMKRQGVGVPAATSMNVSGEPEIVSHVQGVAFCKSHGIPLFLADYKDRGRVRGSFPIVSIDRTGAKLVREGQFPGYLVKYLLGCEVDMSQTVPAKYPVVRTHCEKCAQRVSPHQLHDEIVDYLDNGESAI